MADDWTLDTPEWQLPPTSQEEIALRQDIRRVKRKSMMAGSVASDQMPEQLQVYEKTMTQYQADGEGVDKEIAGNYYNQQQEELTRDMENAPAAAINQESFDVYLDEQQRMEQLKHDKAGADVALTELYQQMYHADPNSPEASMALSTEMANIALAHITDEVRMQLENAGTWDKTLEFAQLLIPGFDIFSEAFSGIGDGTFTDIKEVRSQWLEADNQGKVKILLDAKNTLIENGVNKFVADHIITQIQNPNGDDAIDLVHAISAADLILTLVPILKAGVRGGRLAAQTAKFNKVVNAAMESPEAAQRVLDGQRRFLEKLASKNDAVSMTKRLTGNEQQTGALNVAAASSERGADIMGTTRADATASAMPFKTEGVLTVKADASKETQQLVSRTSTQLLKLQPIKNRLLHVAGALGKDMYSTKDVKEKAMKELEQMLQETDNNFKDGILEFGKFDIKRVDGSVDEFELKMPYTYNGVEEVENRVVKMTMDDMGSMGSLASRDVALSRRALDFFKSASLRFDDIATKDGTTFSRMVEDKTLLDMQTAALQNGFNDLLGQALAPVIGEGKIGRTLKSLTPKKRRSLERVDKFLRMSDEYGGRGQLGRRPTVEELKAGHFINEGAPNEPFVTRSVEGTPTAVDESVLTKIEGESTASNNMYIDKTTKQKYHKSPDGQYFRIVEDPIQNLTDDEIKAIVGYWDVADFAGYMRTDMEFRALKNAGFKRIELADEVFFDAVPMSLQKLRAQARAGEHVYVSDPSALNGRRHINVSDLTDEDIGENMQIVFSRQGIPDGTFGKSQQANLDIVNYIVVPKTSVRELNHADLLTNAREAYVPLLHDGVKYTIKAHYAGTRNGLDDVGRLTNNPDDKAQGVRADVVEMHGNVYDAEGAALRLNELGEEGVYYVVHHDRDTVLSGHNAVGSQGGLGSGARSGRDITYGKHNMPIDRMSAVGSMQIYLNKLSNQYPMVEYRQSMMTRFEHTVAELIGKGGKDGKGTPWRFGDDLPVKQLGGSDQFVRTKLEDVYKYLNDQLLISTAEESAWQQMMRKQMERMERIRGVEEAAPGMHVVKANLARGGEVFFDKAGRMKHPLAMMRSATFYGMLGFGNVSQLFIQAQNAVNTMTIHALSRNAPAVFDPRTYVDLLAIRTMLYWPDEAAEANLRNFSKITRLNGEMAGEDLVQMRKDLVQSGLIDDVLGTADYDQAKAGMPHGMGAWKAINETGLAPFRVGEETGRITSFMLNWKMAKKLKIPAAERQKWILDHTMRDMLNLQSSNKAGFQNHWATANGTQFMQVQTKFLEAILPSKDTRVLGVPVGKPFDALGIGGSRKFTTLEKLKIFGGQLAFYGTATIGGGNALAAAWEKMQGEPLSEEQRHRIQNGFVGALTSQYLGIDVSNRVQLAGTLTEAYKGIFIEEDANYMKAILGASGTLVDRGMSAVEFLGPMISSDEFQFTTDEAKVLAIELASVISSVKNGVDGYDAFVFNRALSSNGKTILRDLSFTEKAGIAAGFTPSREINVYDYMMSDRERNQGIQDAANIGVKLMHRYSRFWETDPDSEETQRAAKQVAFFMETYMEHLPQNDKAKARELFWNKLSEGDSQEAKIYKKILKDTSMGEAAYLQERAIIDQFEGDQ